MRRTIAPTGLAAAAFIWTCAGCAGAPESNADHEVWVAHARMAPQTFEIFLENAPRADMAIDEIAAQAHDRLAAACVGLPGAAVRIWNPLSSGSYADVPCAEILAGEGQATLTSERIGEAPQEWSPVGLACSLLLFGTASAFNWPWGKEGCNNPRADNAEGCRAATGLGLGALGLLCAFI